MATNSRQNNQEDNLAEVPLEVVLGLYFGDVFKQCEESGMVAPFVGCAISPNGSVIALRMDGKSDAQVLTGHTEGAGFTLPMTIVVVDRKNEAAKITVDTTGKITRH